MPKSRRDKVVALTKTAKKGRELKEKLVENVRDSVDQYRHVYVFSVSNMRNVKFKELREVWKTSRFYMGKNKVVQLALGRSEAEEYKENLHLVSAAVRGNCGIFFSNSAPEEVTKYFESYSEPNLARPGFKATKEFVLPAWPIFHPVSMEPMLRKLGLPTRVTDSQVVLAKDAIVCKKDEVLSPEQAKILELFGEQMATMRVRVHAHWHNGEFTELDAADEDGEDQDM